MQYGTKDDWNDYQKAQHCYRHNGIYYLIFIAETYKRDGKEAAYSRLQVALQNEPKNGVPKDLGPYLLENIQALGTFPAQADEKASEKNQDDHDDENNKHYAHVGKHIRFFFFNCIAIFAFLAF